jgi:predicted PurR-regulated permease PerM
MDKQRVVVEISPKSIITAVTILVLALVAWKIRAIIFAVIISIILMSGFSPLVDWFQKKGLNKIVSVVLTYVFAIGTLGLILFAIIPPLIVRGQDFFTDLPAYLNSAVDYLNNTGFVMINSDELTSTLSSRASGYLFEARGILLNVFSGVLTFLTIAVFTFYLLLEKENVKKNMFYFFPHLPKERVTKVVQKIDEKLGAWLRGEFVLMVAVGTFTYIGLTLLRVEFALPLAVLAGLLEVVAMIGPIIAAVPAIMIALVQYNSPLPALGVTALYVLVQQLENNLLVPKIMNRAVGVHPLAIITALLIGGSLFGLMGAILAVPVAATAQVIIEDLHEHSK